MAICQTPCWKQFKINNKLACIAERRKRKEETGRQAGEETGKRERNIWILSEKKRQHKLE